MVHTQKKERKPIYTMRQQLIKDIPPISGTYCWFNSTTIKVGRSKDIRRRIRQCADYDAITAFILPKLNIEQEMVKAVGALYKRVPRSREFFVNDDNGVALLELLNIKGFVKYRCPIIDDFSNWKFMSPGRRCDYKYAAFVSKDYNNICVRTMDQKRPAGNGWMFGFNHFAKPDKGVQDLFTLLSSLNIDDLSEEYAKRLLRVIRDDLEGQNIGKPNMSITAYNKNLKKKLDGRQDLYMTNDIAGILKELERGQL